MNTNQSEQTLINSYSCTGSSWISVLASAVKEGVLTDADVNYPQLGDYHSWYELSDEEGEKWLASLAIRLARLGFKLAELPAPGCMQHPGDGDAWVLARAGEADSEKIDALRAEFERMYLSNLDWHNALYR